ncbi:cupin domain-containing protein [Bradyrhizobium sp. 44]|uniref:cupin domain-containing protein n=1 Tax=unclassified Bradyrhizobium TaxID=2631580 RepID=UPI001FF79792|nr:MULTISPECIES: cupin domain-containing protein [unclassified Bradyrhizobium]MCK1288612.1 cupin domain-containing protein [Bradyrhizobium sp. 44]UPJ43981.1 cupin domain-containing protein [Bradyrhizobium sp. 40]
MSTFLDARPSPTEGTPVNLTEIASGMSWRQACETLRICHRPGTASIRIRPLDGPESGAPDDGSSDTIYVVVSGYGMLRLDSKKMECTAGDLLFIPRGHPHHFDRTDGEIRIWKISLAQDSADES